MSKSPRSKLIYRIEAALAFAFVVLAVSIFFYFMRGPEVDKRRFLAFTVESNESFKSVSLRLRSEGLIRSEHFFYYLGRITGRSGKLKAGEYELNTEMSNWELLEIVTGRHVKLRRITIPEGSTMFEIARLLEEQGLVDEIQFLEAAWDPVLLESLHIPSPTVEGYLFPETYFIARGASARSIIRLMVEMFWRKIPDNFLTAARNNRLSFHQSVILASVIERETGLVGEMSLISSVFMNRIEKRMRLQSDPTAVYDLYPYGRLPVTRAHLARKTPFNTYQILGLPMTPIGNPGLLSIQAAIFPQQTNYLFFVSKRDGSHLFTETYDDHKEGIEKFLRAK